MRKKIVYIAHPIGGDVKSNLESLFKILESINRERKDVIPLAPYIGDVMSLNDDNESDRERGISNSNELIKTLVFDEIWLTGPGVSKGMAAEMKLFISLGLPVKDFTF